MRKVTVITSAVLLAIAIAMGDQIIKLSLSDNPLGLKNIISAIGFGDKGEINIPKPRIPSVTQQKAQEEENLSYDERIKKGDYYFDKQFYVFAANEYVMASNLEPKRTEPYLRMIKADFALLDYQKAGKNAEMILQIDPSNTAAKYYLAVVKIKQNDFTSAETLIADLKTSSATDAKLIYLDALIDMAFNKHNEAKSALNQIIADPNADAKYKTYAQKYLAAYQEFDFAKSAEDLYLQELISRAFSQTEEHELAIYSLKNILKTRPDLRDSWILLGYSYLNLNNYLFALTAFQHAYDLDSEWPATQYFLGITYAELSKYEDAIHYLQYALDNNFQPKNAVMEKLADLYLQTGKYNDSVKLYELILQDNNDDITSFVRPIWIYLEFLNQPDKALKLGEMAVMSFPQSPMAYNLLGWSQIGTKNYVEAEKNLKKAISEDPTIAAVYYNLGKLYEEMDNPKSALDSYQKAYELDQNGSIGNLSAKRYNSLLVK